MAAATVLALPPAATAASYFNYSTISGQNPENVVFDGSGNATLYGAGGTVSFLTSTGAANGTSYSTAGVNGNVGYGVTTDGKVWFGSNSVGGTSGGTSSYVGWAQASPTYGAYYDRVNMSSTFGGNGTLTHPNGIAVDSSNLVYVPMSQEYVGNGTYQDGVALIPAADVSGQGPFNWNTGFGFVPLASPGRATYDATDNRVFILYAGGIAIFQNGAQTGTISTVSGTNLSFDAATDTVWVMGNNSITPINGSTLSVGSAVSLSFSPTQISFPAAGTILATAPTTGHVARIVNAVVDSSFVLYDDNGSGFTGIWQDPVTGDYWANNGTNLELLKLGAPPLVSTQPQSLSVPLNQNFTLTAAADQSVFPGPPTYQWQILTQNRLGGGGSSTWANVNPAYASGNNTTSGTLGLNASCTCDSGDQYRMVITSEAGTVYTNAATVAITQVPAITTQPTGLDATAGQSVTLTSAATGVPAPTPQWRVSTDGGTTWNAITGAASPTYTFSMTQSLDGNQYDAVYTNSAGAATTNSATVHFSAQPTITSPATYVLPTGVASTFSYTATGGGTVTWAITAGTLPAGITLNTSTGALTGTTSVSGSFPVTVRATNVAGSATQSFTMTTGVAPALTTTSPLAAGATEQGYSSSVSATGASPVTFSVSSGSLPAGITLNGATGAITGTPTAPGTSTFSITATNQFGSATGSYSLAVADVPVLATTIPSAAVLNGPSYSASTFVSGSTTSLGFALSAGSLPIGLSLNTTTGAITGQVTASGNLNYAFTVRATNSAGSASAQYTINVMQAPFPTDPFGDSPASPGPNANGPVQVVGGQSANVAWTDGNAGSDGIVTWSISSGTIPPGLTLDTATGDISGTPTTIGTYAYAMTATSQYGSATTTGAQIQVVQPLTVPPSMPNAPLNQAYTFNFGAAVSGGAAPYNYSVTNNLYTGASLAPLPSWLTFDSTFGDPNYGQFTGTPTVAGQYTVQISVQDQNGLTSNPTYTINVGAPPSYLGVSGTLAGGTTATAYSASAAVSSGAPAPTYAITSGTLPPGLTLNTTTGQISGTATAGGTSTFTVTASNVLGTASQSFAIAITAPPAFTGSSMPGGGVGTAYSQPLPATGSGPITFAVTSGALPAGLTLNSSTGVISGTPTAGGTASFTITATNSQGSASQLFTLAIGIAPSMAGVTAPDAVVGTAYSQALTATAGTSPITYSVTGGSLPAGVTLTDTTNGTISGTPTAAGSATFTLTAANAYGSASAQFTVVTRQVPAFGSSFPGAGLVGTAYSFTPLVTGTGPFAFALGSGSLPAGLSLSPSTGAITGTPTGVGTSTFAVVVTGAVGSATLNGSITVNQAPSFSGFANPPFGVVGTPYSGSVAVSSGNGSITYAVTAGSLPAGLALNASTGAITGTPTTATAAPFTVTATSSYGSAAQVVTLPVYRPLSLTPTTPPSGLVGSAYTFTPSVSGSGPITYALTSGSLPAGLSLNPSTGAVTGTPTGSSTASFTITANGPAGSLAIPLSVTVNAAPSLSGVTAPGNGLVGVAYSQSLSATGTGPLTYSLSSGSLPPGLSLNTSTGAVTGTPTTTTSNPAPSFGLTVASPYGSASGTYSILVQQLPTLTGPAAPSGLLGVGYSYTPTISGTGPILYSLGSGTLPPGLILNPANGAITGSPTTSGSFVASVVAIGPAGSTTLSTTIVINTAPSYAGFTPPANPVLGAPYTGSVAVTAGLNVTYALTTGTLPTGLSLNTSTGQLTGTPAAAGPATFTVSATNAYGGPVTQQVTLTTLTLPSFGVSTPPPGQINTAYTYAPTVTGSGPITYALTSGSLPAGLSLNPSTGQITGTPTTAGSYPITLTATGPAGPTNQSVTVSIAQAPSFGGFSAPPNAVVGAAYSGSLAAPAGTGLTYSITSGSLPPGLTLNPATGAVTGSATTTGSYPLTVSASNSLGTATQSVTILAQALPSFSGSPPTGVVGTAYAFTPTVTGTGPITFAVSAGTLPPGLTLNNATGAISGTPASGGSYPFTVTATGPAGSTLQPMSLTVNQPPAYTGVAPLAGTVVGTTYTATVAATAGTGVTYAVTSGSLPAGLVLNPATGVITGHTSATGSTSFTVTATNAFGAAAQVFTIASLALPTITAASPGPGLVGTPYTYPFGGSGFPAPTFTVASGSLPAGLILSPTGVLSGTPTAGGTATFTVQAANSAGAVTTSLITLMTTVPPSPPTTFTAASPGPATTGNPYQYTFVANGFSAPVYAVASGSLPGGLSLSATGVLSGTPTAAGSWTFTVSATNASGVLTSSTITVTVSAPASSRGYHLVAADGGVFSFGAAFYGSTGNLKLNQPVFAITSTADGNGYWFVARDGGVFSYGDAGFHGSVPAMGLHLTDMVGMAADTATGGYWLVGSDGGVYAFDAPFLGSVPGLGQQRSNIVGIAATPDGGGYYLVASSGSVYAFGDARYQGSAGATGPTAQPVVGITVDSATGGYWEVSASGAVYSYGAPFHGSTDGLRLTGPIVGISATADGSGYYLVGSDGGVFAFDAPFVGSMGNQHLNAPVVGMATVGDR